MKTKFGNCNNCALVTSKQYHKNSVTSNNNDVHDADILIISEYNKYGKDVSIFLDKNYPDWKYVVINGYVCDDSGIDNFDSIVCCNNCIKTILAMCNKVNAKRKFVLGINYQEKLEGFHSVSSIEELDKVLKKEIQENQKIEEQKKYFSFKIPEKYYTDEYRLIDIQYVANKDLLVYIFRDKDNNKEYFEFPKFEKDFYWYESVNTNKIIEKIDNLRLVTGKYKDRDRTKKSYGADIDITTKHSVDYFLNNKKEAPIIRQNILFFDIETYQYCNKVFPDPDKAEYPIVAISFRTDDPNDFTHVYLLNMKDQVDHNLKSLIKSGDYPYITVFDNEVLMLKSFFSYLRRANIDFLAGWNISGFDIPYIVKRMHNLEINPNEFSPYGNIFAESKSGRNEITGYVVMDQLKLFKELTYQTQPSYSLNAIAGVVLGKEKVQHVGKSIDDMYHSDIKLFMDYSQQDTNLIYEIDVEVKHIGLQDEIRRVATVSHKGANSTIGQAEGLYATELKKIGCVSRNYTHDIVKEKFPGAYVYDSPGGLFEGLLCDFDYTSLYPSIIRTFNIGNDSYIAKIDEDIARAFIFNKHMLKNKIFEIVIDPVHNNKKQKINFLTFEKFIEKYHAQVSIVGTIFCGHDIHKSINCEMLTMLMNSRKIYKKKMLNAKENGDIQMTIEYNAKQLAFKIIANALYGILGNEHWRFYLPDLGKTITLTGQEMLKYAATRISDYMDGIINESNHPIDNGFEPKAVFNENVRYGDTDSCFIDLTNYLNKKKIPLDYKNNQVQIEINNIQNFINNIALPQLLNMHNVNLKYSVMNLKNEFTYTRYYSLQGSKHYCSHVVIQEGKNVNYIDVKGLEVKRSEIPPLSQEMLQTIIDTIMDDNHKKYELKPIIDNIVDQYKNKMLNIIKDRKIGVARIVSYSKDLSEYRVMPQHIKGMLMWNELTGIEDFKKGTKGKLWNILGVDIDKAPKEIQERYHKYFLKKFQVGDLKCICTPENIEVLPEYFIIDINSMISYACDDRASALLQPLWVESESECLF